MILNESRVRIWYQQYESMDSTCLVSSVYNGDGVVMLWVMFLGIFCDPLTPKQPCLQSRTVGIVLSMRIPLWPPFDHILKVTQEGIERRNKRKRSGMEENT